MKKLGKLRLCDVSVLSDGEMKKVVGGYNSSGDKDACFWFYCVCSGPQSVVYSESISRLVQGTDIIEETSKLAKGDCRLFNQVACTVNRPC